MAMRKKKKEQRLFEGFNWSWRVEELGFSVFPCQDFACLFSLQWKEIGIEILVFAQVDR